MIYAARERGKAMKGERQGLPQRAQGKAREQEQGSKALPQRRGGHRENKKKAQPQWTRRKTKGQQIATHESGAPRKTTCDLRLAGLC